MAWFDSPGNETHWGDAETHIWESVVGSNDEAMNDAHLAQLFADSILSGNNTHHSAELEDYLWEEYGINFADEMDWEAWREWYQGSH